MKVTWNTQNFLESIANNYVTEVHRLIIHEQCNHVLIRDSWRIGTSSKLQKNQFCFFLFSLLVELEHGNWNIWMCAGPVHYSEDKSGTTDGRTNRKTGSFCWQCCLDPHGSGFLLLPLPYPVLVWLVAPEHDHQSRWVRLVLLDSSLSTASPSCPILLTTFWLTSIQ